MNRTALKFVVLGTAVFILPAASLALPRQNTTHPCFCVCNAQLGNGQWVAPYANFSLPNQYACTLANNKGCNIDDPTTGGVAQGTLLFCGDGTAATHVTVPRGTLPPITNPAPPIQRR